MANYVSAHTGEQIDNGVDIALNNVITKDNTTSFTPSGDYNPATKKYVDDTTDLLSNATYHALAELDNEKQALLVSGTNIKTINGTSVLGSGDIEIQAGDTTVFVDCATARTTVAKVGTTIAGNYVPQKGDKLVVTFTGGISVSNPTLNIDGSGAKNIKIGTTNISADYLSTSAGSITPVAMWFDGDAYQLYGSYVNTKSDINGYNIGVYNTGIEVGETIYRYKIVMEGMDGKFYPLFPENLNTPAKSVSTVSFKPGGDIYYYNTASTTNPGITISSNFWRQYCIGLSDTYMAFAVNIDPSWVAGATLYLKGTINETGGFVLNQTTPITTTLPTTDDGFVYRPFGTKGTEATPTWGVIPNNIMYQFKNGKLSFYGGSGVKTYIQTQEPLDAVAGDIWIQ